MIEVQNLTKRFPTRVAVDDVTFSVKSGEIVGFLGPNGAGKTTTMRVLTGFLPPTSGSARVAGHDVVSDSRKARAAVGYLPESAALYPEMRVNEFLAYRARLEGVRGAAVRERVSEAVERCLLSEVAGRRIENLSKGFRQRTSLAGTRPARTRRNPCRPAGGGQDLPGQLRQSLLALCRSGGAAQTHKFDPHP